MKKIAFFISSLNIGGIEKALLSMISKMDLKENKIYVYTIKKEGALLKEILKYAEVREIPMLKETILYDLRKTLKEDLLKFKMNKVLKMVTGKIKKLITKKDENFNILKMKPLDEKFDIAVAYQVPISPITVYVAEKVNSTKKVLWVHSDIAGLENLKQKQYEQYIEKYNKVFTVADKCKKSFLESFPTMKEKTENFYNLIPKEDIVQKSKDKQKEEYAEDYFNIVTVARLTPGKGYEIALLILKELIKRECKVRWYGIGTGELKEYLETEIIRSGDLVIDVVHNMIFKKGRELSIKDTEFRLCYMLVRNDGRIMPRELLLERLWDMDEHFIENNTLSVYVSRLRKKLGVYNGVSYIETIKGIGYRWNHLVQRGEFNE